MKSVSTEDNNFRIKHLASGFLMVIVLSCIFLFFPFLWNESTLILIIFDILFVFLIFPLNGPLKTKMSMILIGNVIFWLWNNLFSLFVCVVEFYVGVSFNVLHMLLSPSVNLLWMVSFWSLSLTTLANSKRERRGTRFAY